MTTAIRLSITMLSPYPALSIVTIFQVAIPHSHLFHGNPTPHSRETPPVMHSYALTIPSSFQDNHPLVDNSSPKLHPSLSTVTNFWTVPVVTSLRSCLPVLFPIAASFHNNLPPPSSVYCPSGHSHGNHHPLAPYALATPSSSHENPSQTVPMVNAHWLHIPLLSWYLSSSMVTTPSDFHGSPPSSYDANLRNGCSTALAVNMLAVLVPKYDSKKNSGCCAMNYELAFTSMCTNL